MYIRIVLSLVLLQCCTLKGQSLSAHLFNQGIPAITNFYEQDFNSEATNYDLCYGENDFLYAINLRGILEYDGYYWRIIHKYHANPKDRIFYFDSKLYYLKENTLGVLVPDNNGFFSDSVLFTGKILNSSYSTEKIHQIDSVIYFITEHSVVSVNNTTGEVLETPSGSMLGGSAILNNTLVIHEYKNGLLEFTGNSFSLYYTNETIKQSRVFDILVTDSNQVVLNIIGKGLYSWHDNDFSLLSGFDAYFLKGLYYNGVIYYSTLMNGIMALDNKGQINKQINSALGLSDNNPTDLCFDNNKHIWASCKNGISHIATELPFTIYNKDVGLNSKIINVVNYKNKVYLCTRNGVYRIKNSKIDTGALEEEHVQLIDKITGIDGICLWAYTYKDFLMVSTLRGIFIVDGQNAVPLKDYPFRKKSSATEYQLFQSFSGFMLYKYQNNTIERVGYEKWMSGNLTFGLSKAWQIDSTKLLAFDYSTGKIKKEEFALPDSLLTRSKYLFTTNTDLYLASYGHVYKYSFTTNKWQIDGSFNTILDEDKMIVNCHFATDSEFLLSVADRNNYQNYQTALYEKTGTDLQPRLVLSDYLEGRKIDYIQIQNKQLWWIVTTNDLLAFNPERVKTRRSLGGIRIRKVETDENNQITWLGYGNTNIREYPFAQNQLSFQFVCNSFLDKDDVEYSYMLEGYSKQWSPYSKTNIVNYTNLHEGSYKLLVKARYKDGTVSAADDFVFSILSPWYRTWWALIFYLLLTLLFVYLLFRWRLAYLEKDRKRLEGKIELRTKQLSEKTKELEEMDKVKSNFFANISHELRTPLTLIVGLLDKLITKEKQADNLKDFTVMKRNSEVLRRHIEQFLDLSKIEAGKLQMHKEEINLNSFLARIVSSFESLAEIKNVKLHYNSGSKQVHCFADVQQLEIVFNNILSNAIKFTPQQGQVKLSISATNNIVEVKVADTGIGIAQENLPYIFKRFYQADTSATKKYEGTGIGLALCYEIIELHKGTIRAESVKDEGTIITVQLPLVEAAGSDSPAEVNTMQQSGVAPKEYYSVDSENPQENRPLVLVVEDNLDMQQYLKDLLSKEFEVHLAENGEVGLHKAAKLNPHLIVSDVMMPVMDGFSMVDEIRADQKICHIPIILLTARADEESKLQGLRKGVEEYLSKPFSKTELIIRINNIVNRREKFKQRLTKTLVLEPANSDIASLDEVFLTKVGELIEKHITNSEFDVQLLSDKLGISRRHLHRKLKLITDMTPSEFIRSYRLKKAAQLIAANSDSVSQIAYSVGFDDLSYFAKCFKVQYGKTPSDYGK